MRRASGRGGGVGLVLDSEELCGADGRVVDETEGGGDASGC